MTEDDLDDLFEGAKPAAREKRQAPEPAPQDDGALKVGADLFPPRKVSKVVPLDSTALTVDVDDFFEPRAQPAPA